MLVEAQLSDCTHGWRQDGEHITLTYILDDWLGPTLAIIECKSCQQSALLYLVAWQGRQLCHRIFGVRELSNEVTETYIANISRDYCDLTRKQSETETLIQAAAARTCLIQLECPETVIQRHVDIDTTPPVKEWQDVEEQSWNPWQQQLIE